MLPSFAYIDSGGRSFPVFYVIDHFYDDPEKVRTFATASDYKRPLVTGTQALISTRRHPDTHEVLERIGELIGVRPDLATLEINYRFWGEVSCGEFQLSLSPNDHRGVAHSHWNGEWVGIVYLSRPRDCSGRVGTYILKHKQSGAFRWQGAPNDEYDALRADCGNDQAWEVVYSPDMLFNRLFVFDSRFFHAESAGFGDGPTTGRLVHIFNFSTLSKYHTART